MAKAEPLRLNPGVSAETSEEEILVSPPGVAGLTEHGCVSLELEPPAHSVRGNSLSRGCQHEGGGRAERQSPRLIVPLGLPGRA